MTMPAMKMGLIALLLVAAGSSACASGAGAGTGPGARAAPSEAKDVLEAVSKLEHRYTAMRRRLAVANAANRAMTERLDGMSHGLWRAAGKLRTAVGELKSQIGVAAGAQTSATSALDKALQISRDLSVLEQRFDYHLRHSGGA